MIEDRREPDYTKEDGCSECGGEGIISTPHICPNVFVNSQCLHCHGTGIEPPLRSLRIPDNVNHA